MKPQMTAALLGLAMTAPEPMNYSRRGANTQPKMSTTKRRAKKKRKAARKARRNNR